MFTEGPRHVSFGIIVRGVWQVPDCCSWFQRFWFHSRQKVFSPHVVIEVNASVVRGHHWCPGFSFVRALWLLFLRCASVTELYADPLCFHDVADFSTLVFWCATCCVVRVVRPHFWLCFKARLLLDLAILYLRCWRELRSNVFVGRFTSPGSKSSSWDVIQAATASCMLDLFSPNTLLVVTRSIGTSRLPRMGT